MNYRFFIIGALLLLIGAQLRLVDSFVLTPRATQFIQSKMRNSSVARRSNYGGYDSLPQRWPSPEENADASQMVWLGRTFGGWRFAVAWSHHAARRVIATNPSAKRTSDRITPEKSM